MTAEVTCPGNGKQSRPVTLTIVADGTSEHVELTREVTVACE